MVRELHHANVPLEQVIDRPLHAECLVGFVNDVQTSIGAYTLGDATKVEVLDRLAESAKRLSALRDLVVARSIAAAVCLQVEPSLSQASALALRGLLTASTAQAIEHCLRDLSSVLSQGAVREHLSRTALTCSRLVAAIRANATKPDISLMKIAALCGISKWHACHVLRACRHSNYRDELRSARMLHARALLRQSASDLALKEVAYRCGYGRKSSLFARHFRAAVGVSPTAFRQQLPSRDSNSRQVQPR
jgi:AraC-like DNA-binding protein